MKNKYLNIIKEKLISKSHTLNRKQSEILLATLIIARATAYMFSKLLLKSMGQYTLIGVRNSIAFIILVIFCFRILKKSTKKDVMYGIVAGSAFFVVMASELAGLKHTSSISISFEQNTAVVIAPIMLAFINNKLPKAKQIIVFVLCGIGIFLLNYNPNGLDFNIGDFYGMMSAITYAMTIIIIAYISKKADPLRIGIYQVGTMAILSLVMASIFENPVLPSSTTEWTYMMYLAIVCSVFGFTLQPFAQRGTTAERASIMCALNPVTAAILGVVFLGEELTLRGLIGALMILVSIIL